MKKYRNHLFTFALVCTVIFTLLGCQDHQAGKSGYGKSTRHSGHSHGSIRQVYNTPTNQVAILTVWAEAGKFEETAKFYKNVLGLRKVSSGSGQYILDTDGSFIVIMEGTLEQPRDTQRRWPLFALTVSDIEESVQKLTVAGVEFPWGIEEYDKPDPGSRYVMFYDPAGNLIELVEWL